VVSCLAMKPARAIRGSYSLSLGILLTLLVTLACGPNNEIPPPSREKFSECSGVIAFRSGEEWTDTAAVRVYSEDATIWYSADFKRPEFNAIRDMGPNPIAPLAFVRGGYSPEFRCTGSSPNWFRVIATEAAGNPLIKYIRRNDRLFEWKAWDQYYLMRYIRFDQEKNPLYAKRGGGEVVVPPKEIEHFRAAKLEGDWLQVDWKERRFVDGRNIAEQKTAWLKWRDPTKDTILAVPFQ
jgi:hypothetical protein